MTPKQRATLAELIERVEKGDLFMVPNGETAYRAVDDDERKWNLLFSAYAGDTTDAISLLAHLLPGAQWTMAKGSNECACMIDLPDVLILRTATHPTLPSRALLLATLMAKLGEAE